MRDMCTDALGNTEGKPGTASWRRKQRVRREVSGQMIWDKQRLRGDEVVAMGRTRSLAAALRSSHFRCMFKKITPAKVRKRDCTGET